MKTQIKNILKKTLEELFYHRTDENTQLFYSEEKRTFTYLDDQDNNFKPITNQDAKRIMLRLINLELKRIGKIYLYTCKDNSILTIEHPTREELEDEDFQYAFNYTPTPNLFIGID